MGVDVRFVCTGNSARSRLAEIIGNKQARERDLHRLIRFSSAGTSVGKDKSWNSDYVRKILQTAKRAGDIDKYSVDDRRYENEPKYKKMIDDYARCIIEEFFRPREAFFRNEVIVQKGITGYSSLGLMRSLVGKDLIRNPHPTPCNYDPEVYLWLGMVDKHVNFMRENFPISTHIALINEFAGLESQIPNKFGETSIKPYLELYDKLDREYLPRVLDRLVVELGD
ncbi:hypothetical protein H6503_02665 [Candidatus Woesearchaeota archaeon]|nr:hypothetical protein [Candidatus Woesearchaeota archaeon]